MLGASRRTDQNELTRHDTIVIGAGIVGAACAFRLAGLGQRVLVLDPNMPGTGATAACMGHIVIMDDSAAQFALCQYSRKQWLELLPRMPKNCELSRCGTIWVAADEAEMQAVQQKEQRYREAGIACEVLDNGSLRAQEPNLHPDLAGGLLVPDDLSVYPTNCTNWFLRNVEMRTAVKVVSIREGQVEDDRGNRYLADHIVLAAGGLSVQLLADLPISPRKGHLVITERAEGFCSHQIVELGYLRSAHQMQSESVAFNIQPRTTGQMLLGSSREFCGWDSSINRNIVRKMIERGIEFMPALAELSAIRIWTGFRPCTIDKLPLIGAWSAVPGLYVAAGHEGLGITTSLGTAELIASAISGRQPAFDPGPYLPSRATERATETAS